MTSRVPLPPPEPASSVSRSSCENAPLSPSGPEPPLKPGTRQVFNGKKQHPGRRFPLGCILEQAVNGPPWACGLLQVMFSPQPPHERRRALVARRSSSATRACTLRLPPARREKPWPSFDRPAGVVGCWGRKPMGSPPEIWDCARGAYCGDAMSSGATWVPLS
ncbi:hypothetical protein C8Q77DRAFT_793907 [Trametes polyzona]|nr:hypothetical protein C8Q77DRAFT_793907 [Trametes polyzona]